MRAIAPTAKETKASGVGPILGFATDRAEGQAPDRQGNRDRAGPVKPARGTFVARLGDMSGCDKSEENKRHVDEEHSTPREGRNQESSKSGPEDSGCSRGTGPHAERATLLFAFERSADDGQRARDQDGSGCSLEHSTQDQQIHRGSKSTQNRRNAESHQADNEKLSPSVKVRKSAGENQKCTQR